MSGVELGLAIIATVDLCFKYGNALVDICASIKNAESEMLERCVRLESIWVRTKCQLDFLKSIWQTLDETHQRIQVQILDILVSKLKAASTRMQNVAGTSTDQNPAAKLQRLKYAFCKEGLDKSLDELAAWQGMFDPSWFLIMRAANSQIDLALVNADEESKRVAITSASHVRDAVRPETANRASIFLPTKGLELAQISHVPLSSIRLAQRKGSSKWLVLDTITPPFNVDSSIFTRDVRDIARKLRYVDPLIFHLLSCSGVVKNLDAGQVGSKSFTFVFKLPDGASSTCSLRSVLCGDRAEHSLSERLQVAKDLARAVSHVHNLGFVHKNIRPETILLLGDQVSALGSAYLVGFEAFRSADGHTLKRGDTMWYLNLYRHPDRRGEVPTKEYSMQHDIYSLGVCLLELGLFESFLLYDDKGFPKSASTKLELDMYSDQIGYPDVSKEHLVELARKELPRRMGTRYANVTITCLTCLDSGNHTFGDESEFQDEDGILVSVRYIEKVNDSCEMGLEHNADMIRSWSSSTKFVSETEPHTVVTSTFSCRRAHHSRKVIRSSSESNSYPRFWT